MRMLTSRAEGAAAGAQALVVGQAGGHGRSADADFDVAGPAGEEPVGRSRNLRRRYSFLESRAGVRWPLCVSVLCMAKYFTMRTLVPSTNCTSSSQSEFWRDHFARNLAVTALLPWHDAPCLTPDERAAIQSSIQQFQLGEGSSGRRLLDRARASLPRRLATTRSSRPLRCSSARSSGTAASYSDSWSGKAYRRCRSTGSIRSSGGCACWRDSNFPCACW